MARSRTVHLKILSILLALTLVAAACGGDDDSEALGTDDETPEEPAPSEDDDGDEEDDEAPEPMDVDDASDDRADWPDKIILAAVPAEQDAQLQESYRVTREILEDELDLEVEFFQAADYAGVVEALIADRVDLAQFGPFSYVIAIANGADAEPVGVMVEEEGGEPGYQAFLVAQSDNDDINELADVEGKRLCFVDPGSTSGYLYPIAGLLELGIDPEDDVDAIFAGGHDASAISVASGDCDAGYAFDSMVEVLLPERGELEPDELKVVWESEVIAGSPMAMRNGLPESLRVAIRDIFDNKINVDWAADNGYCESNDPAECSFSDEAIWGYVHRDDSFYEGVRAVCRETGAEQCDGVS